VVYTWQVITDPDLPIPTRTVWRDIVSIETPDERTAVVTFADTNVSFLGAASFAGAFLLPSHLLEGTDLANSPFHRLPVGNGPFRLAEWQAGSFLRFERHDAYWDGAAHFDSVVIRIVPGSEAQRTVLSRGEADLVLQVALTELPFLETLPNYRRASVPTFANWQLWLNNEDPALADVRVRRALSTPSTAQLIAEPCSAASASRPTPRCRRRTGPTPTTCGPTRTTSPRRSGSSTRPAGTRRGHPAPSAPGGARRCASR
jgi:ABC-type transport system substrate-binding protein